MDEYVDIVNKKGKLTEDSCVKVRRIVGHYHNTVHVWLFTTDGEILLQQRALSKEICPVCGMYLRQGMWIW